MVKPSPSTSAVVPLSANDENGLSNMPDYSCVRSVFMMKIYGILTEPSSLDYTYIQLDRIKLHYVNEPYRESRSSKAH
jgi:hypothetical protein